MGLIEIIRHHMPICHCPCCRRSIGPSPSCCDHRSRTKCLHLNSPHPAWRARSHSHRPLNIPEFIILERVEPSSRSFPFPLAESQSKPPLLEDPGWREEKRGERIRIYLPRLWNAATARDLETQRKRRTSTFLPRPVSRYNLS